jgi:pyruvate/2-oxoglutarate dehydrogenase complex dihydrolipoamide dehydrogenase (E3) component
LIDPKEYFEDITAQPKAICSPGADMKDSESYWPRSVCSFKGSTITNGRLISGFLTAVAKDHVQVGSKRTVVQYDYLVLATGSSYASNIKAPNASLEFRHKQMTQEYKALKDASSVLVIGGGLVGCEIAGDIKDEFPDHKVTIVQRGSAFLPRVRGAHAKVCEVWDEMGIEWHVNESIEQLDEMSGKYTSKSGREFTADKVYICSGPKANTGYLYDRQTDSRFTAALDRRSFVKAQ